MIPLFPLDVVLLPGAVLPLHIFEPRYREMISECLAQKKVFGVVRSQAEGVADIGCTAEISEVTKAYPDGRMDILTIGRTRFEVMRVSEERSFLQAEIVYIDDDPGEATAQEVKEALDLRSEILQLAGAGESAEASSPSSSFQLIGSLPLDLDFKQLLLGMKSEAERIKAIVVYFQTVLPSLRRAARIREKAGGNGHGG